MITLERYYNSTQFKEDALDFIAKYPIENNLIYGILLNEQRLKKALFMAIAYLNGQICAVFLQTEREEVFISKTTPLSNSQIKSLTYHLMNSYPQIPGLVGETPIIDIMSEEIMLIEGRTIKKIMRQGIYKLSKVLKPNRNNGIYRLGNNDDQAFIEECCNHFYQECHLGSLTSEIKERVSNWIKNGNLYILEIDKQIVSMCVTVRPTKNTICISFVYTPKNKRKNGYASDIVAYVNLEMLNRGYIATALYTDLDNPTSNKIYQEIGYEFVIKSTAIEFFIQQPIETERLILREWEESDSADLYEYAKNPLVGPNAGWLPHQNEYESKSIIDLFRKNDEVYAIVLKSNNKVIGSIGLHQRTPDSKLLTYEQREIGYVLNPKYWGNGYTPEAVNKIIEYGFKKLKLDLIWCGHYDFNHNSKRVIEKCGFKYMFMRKEILPHLNNKEVNQLYYLITKNEYLYKK